MSIEKEGDITLRHANFTKNSASALCMSDSTVVTLHKFLTTLENLVEGFIPSYPLKSTTFLTATLLQVVRGSVLGGRESAV